MASFSKYFAKFNRFCNQRCCSTTNSEPIDTEILRVAIIGRPNSGKSSFINNITGHNFMATSDIPHTTDKCVTAYLTVDKIQITLTDTPGVVESTQRSKSRCANDNVKMLETVPFDNFDLIATMVDVYLYRRHPYLSPSIQAILTHTQHIPSICLLSKVETLFRRSVDRIERNIQKPPQIASNINISDCTAGGWDKFDKIFKISNKTGEGIDDVLRYMLINAKPGPHQFPSKVGVDQSIEEFISEIARESLFVHTIQEMPFRTTIDVRIVSSTPSILSVRVNFHGNNKTSNQYIAEKSTIIQSFIEHRIHQMFPRRQIIVILDTYI